MRDRVVGTVALPCHVSPFFRRAGVPIHPGGEEEEETVLLDAWDLLFMLNACWVTRTGGLSRDSLDQCFGLTTPSSCRG